MSARCALAARIMVVLVALLALGPHRADAQGRGGTPESRLLRQAAALESSGDLDGAAQTLRSVLELNPMSSGAIHALARVLTLKGEGASVLSVIDEYLGQRKDDALRSLKLSVLADVASEADVVAEAERWLAEDPADPVPYREVAGVYETAFGRGRALEVLRRGERSVEEGALALELGDLLGRMGDLDQAVEEWALTVRRDGSGSEAARRRVQGLREGREEAGRRLVAALGGSDVPGRRRAAVQVAIELDLAPEALELAQAYANDLEEPAKERFLAEIGALARGAGHTDLASWAYGELGEYASSPEERRQFDLRVVDVSLTAGDTVAAAAAQRRVADSYRDGTEERRHADARAIELEASGAPPEQALASWERFRSEYPRAPELDELAASVAVAFIASGDQEGAEQVLQGVDGPRSSLERGFLLLERGEIEEARGWLLLAAPGLLPSEATPVIQLAVLLSRVSAGGANALAVASVGEHRGFGEAAASRLAADTEGLPPEDRPTLLAEAARIADRSGARDVAAHIRERILADHPDAAEAREASLALARSYAEPGGDVDAAIKLLEDLIISHPEAAVVPEARFELERLRGRGS